MNEHTYWNSNGPEQAKYDEMEAAGFKYTKATQTVFHSYYRYYNDGDLPDWGRTTSCTLPSPPLSCSSPVDS